MKTPDDKGDSAGNPSAEDQERRRVLSEGFLAMDEEQREEFEDYVRRCNGAPISNIKP